MLAIQNLRLGAPLLALLVLACSSGGDVGPDDEGPASVTIHPDGMTLPVGGQGTLTAEVRDQSSAPIPGAAVSWTSLAPPIAAVSATGTVTGETVGLTRIVARAGTSEDTVGCWSSTTSRSRSFRPRRR